jgi:hypothetical protein
LYCFSKDRSATKRLPEACLPGKKNPALQYVRTGFHLWRRRRGSNPRTLARLPVFETGPFSLLGTSPNSRHDYTIISTEHLLMKTMKIFSTNIHENFNVNCDGSLAVLMNTQNPDVAYWPHFLFQKVVKFYDFICSNVSHCVLYCI